MNEEKKDPDQVLEDITKDIVSKKMWESYNSNHELEEFFNALLNVSSATKRKTVRLEDDLKET